MPRRPVLRRTIGVLAAAALIATGATATSFRALPGTSLAGVAQAASPTAPATLLAHMRIVLPSLVLTGGEARKLDFVIDSNAYDNKYPPDARATFRTPLPGQTSNSPMMSEFFAGGFVLGKAENLVGHVRPGNVSVVVWAFRGPEGAFRGLRALRDLSGLHTAASPFAPGAILLSLPGTGVSDLIWVRGRALVRASAGKAPGGRSMAHDRDLVARVVDAKIDSEPSVGAVALPPAPRLDLSTLAGRLGSLRVAENDLPGGLDTRSWRLRARPDARDPLRGDAAAARLNRRYRALGLMGGSAQVISVAQIHGHYAAYAWAFPSAAAARAALRAAESQRGVRVTPAPVVRAGLRVVRPGRSLLDDLFWVRGSVLLQVGGYGPPDIPLLESRQALVARALDAKASALR
ncbi:MAG TPA: hypothetical protein VFD90_12155 [Gaiellales bacterium]|jgi:hypothetical protein|nr:hypothetical protein [Gaiellales bacterium]